MGTSRMASIDIVDVAGAAGVAEAPAVEERELTLTPGQALQLAIDRHGAGELDDAEMLYTVLLERWPDHADVLNHLGVLRHQRGDPQGALALLRRAVERAPDSAGVWNNLGNVLLRLNQPDAEAAFRHSIELAESPAAHANLSRVLRRRKQWHESEAACRRALALAPDFGDAWHNLSLVLLGQRCVPEGIQAASKALTLLPAHKRRRDATTRALVLLGETAQAAAIFREWLAEEPDNPYVKHHLAACCGAPAPARASDEYVELAFDDFAESFDAKLAQLQYQAPQLVAEALRAVLPPTARQFNIADLGCGTGLCGPLVHAWSRHLAGCDLSGVMLQHAQRRGVYDALEKAELVDFLSARPAAFDVVISADTLCYLRDLGGVAHAAQRALRPVGHVVFTVEALPGADSAPYRLRPNGRYAHAPSYLEVVLGAAGLLRKQISSAVLREEGGQAVDGWLVVASSAASTPEHTP